MANENFGSHINRLNSNKILYETLQLNWPMKVILSSFQEVIVEIVQISFFISNFKYHMK